MAQVSIIIPALNEAQNLTPLTHRIAAALTDYSYEIIIVDDNSPDDTADVCAQLSQQFPLHLIVREHPQAGLSGAVLEGMHHATGDYLVVMDADLQHPPEKIPEMLALLEQDQAEFVIGSRYISGGTTQQQWGLFRWINSKIATWLARPFCGSVRDPMSGFFVLKRKTFQRGTHLVPLGYKIGLELMSKCHIRKVTEVPIDFGLREHGQSKLTLHEQFRYLEHLSRLYDYSFPRLSPAIKFLIVILLSALLAISLCTGLLALGLSVKLSLIFSYPAALLATAIFHTRYVRTQKDFLIRQTPRRDFALISITEWLGFTLITLYTLHRLNHPTPAEAFTLAFLSAMILRYILRKELLQDIRGLRKDRRTPPSP